MIEIVKRLADVITYHLSDSVFPKMSRQIRIIVEQKMEREMENFQEMKIASL